MSSYPRRFPPASSPSSVPRPVTRRRVVILSASEGSLFPSAPSPSPLARAILFPHARRPRQSPIARHWHFALDRRSRLHSRLPAYARAFRAAAYRAMRAQRRRRAGLRLLPPPFFPCRRQALSFASVRILLYQRRHHHSSAKVASGPTRRPCGHQRRFPPRRSARLRGLRSLVRALASFRDRRQSGPPQSAYSSHLETCPRSHAILSAF
jgi:hypothetical protein